MNSAVSVIDHPNDETLAAFVDGRLDAAAREDVMKHAADCTDCRDVVLLATEIAAEEAPSNVVRGRFDYRRIIAPLVAVAATIVVVFGIPSVRERILGGAMSDVAELARTIDERPTDARLSVDVSYKPAKDTFRNGAEEEPVQDVDYRAKLAAAEAEERASQRPTVENFHALGVASMLAGNRGEAVRALESAVAKAEKPSAMLLNDLAAAYLDRGSKGDYERALAFANRSLQLERTLAGAWNKALALERLHLDAWAIAAWQEYIELETDPAWEAEARRQIESLQELR